MIQPHLPIRLPCYDFTPVIGPAFGSSFFAVRSLTSGVTDSHGVTGGVYKTRERIHRGILIRESLDFANEDECVEVTPESIRVRKIILSREDWYKWRAKQRRQNNAQNNK